MKNITIVVGARPNYIKADPVIRALLGAKDQFNVTVVNTGQHYDTNMSRVFFDELEMKKPDINLEVGSGSHGEQTAKILERFEKLILSKRIDPDLVIVFGDVNSTIACTLAAVKLHIPVAHVEAGLRSFDRSMPEEINRVLTDQICDLLFTTSPEARKHLTLEGIPPEKIHFVGNTMIDTLVRLLPQFNLSNIRSRLNIKNTPYALMTFHRPSNVDKDDQLAALVRAIGKISDDLKCVFPAHPRTRNKLVQMDLMEKLTNNNNIVFCEPLGYIDFMNLQKNAKIIITDSGGIQEESTFFGVPCLTTRDNTERPVTVTEGSNRLVGADFSKLCSYVKDTLYNPNRNYKIPALWDGHAAERILKAL